MRRAAALLALTLLVACAHGPDVPAWLALRVGTPARLGASDPLEPEHTTLYASADAARAARRDPAARRTVSGTVVTIAQIDDRTVDGKHAVDVADAHGPLGWVVAEDALFPIPPPGTALTVAATAHGRPQLLFTEQDDDDGIAFGATSTVTFEGFVSDPGNPEYHVHVDSGPLAGYNGYVGWDELAGPQAESFRLVAGGR